MRNHLVVVLLSAVGLFACGGTKEEAKSAADPWADFKGTYSQPSAAHSDTKADKGDDASSKKSAKAKSDPAADKKADEAAATPAKKSPSHGNVKGESISTISVDTLTDASKSTLKGKFVSNSVVTGAQYEVVQVQLKGTTVQITRAADKPAPNGPAVASPKAKSSSLGKNDAGWYDEEADVLVVVTSGKKAAAQKALNTLVSH